MADRWKHPYNNFKDRFDAGARYYMGPHLYQGVTGLLGALNLAAMFSDAADVKDAYDSSQETMRALREKDYSGAGLGLLGTGAAMTAAAIPAVSAKMIKGGAKGLLNAGEEVLEKKPGMLRKKRAVEAYGFDPAARYPEAGRELKIDKTSGNEYWGKAETAESKKIRKAVLAAQRRIDAGDYEPFFDVSKRADVDPANYPLPGGLTRDVTMPKRAETIEKYTAMANDPAGLDRIREAYRVGSEMPNADNWYFMKQLEDEFVKEFGADKGRELFKQRFALPMAATTGGADPTQNFRMAMYGNYLREQGLPYPEASWQMPYPIGGRYVTGNMGHHKAIMDAGELDAVTNPKRHNFGYNFMGHPSLITLDEQMSGLWDPKLAQPPNYATYERAVDELAQELGIDPRKLQEVSWAGQKATKEGGREYVTSKPMIQIVNEAIERTASVTGLSREEVVREGLLKGKIPIYGLGGLAATGAATRAGLLNREDEEVVY